MVGASREMVSRVMKDFEDQGFIKTNKDGGIRVWGATLQATLIYRVCAAAKRAAHHAHDLFTPHSSFTDPARRRQNLPPAGLSRFANEIALVVGFVLLALWLIALLSHSVQGCRLVDIRLRCAPTQ